MAEVREEMREMGEKGKRADQRGSKRAEEPGKEGKTRKRSVKGYGVDRLRTATERRMAESSEALAKTLMDNALKGKLESVKILMKLAEEEKTRREEEREEDTPRLSELLVGSVVKIGQMWDGHRWRRVAKSRILEEGCAKWEDLVGRHHEDSEEDELEEAA
jgi:hypothetical protein